MVSSCVFVSYSITMQILTPPQIWRTYTVFRKNIWVVVLPILASVMNTCEQYGTKQLWVIHWRSSQGSGCVVVWALSKAHPGANIFQTVSSWITAFFVLTMSVNVSCTGVYILVYQIYIILMKFFSCDCLAYLPDKSPKHQHTRRSQSQACRFSDHWERSSVYLWSSRTTHCILDGI